MFIDTLRPEGTSGRICEAAVPTGLTNSAGGEPVGPVSINVQPLTGLGTWLGVFCVYKH
jgi:hypothetical protein